MRFSIPTRRVTAMTNPTPERIAEGLERWPGYNEQSWAERFAELDRQHEALRAKLFRLATHPDFVRARTIGFGAVSSRNHLKETADAW